jgi:2-dehydro-3-deoxyphosphogalactonate aldolase
MTQSVSQPVSLNDRWQDALKTLPLVAIVRGIRPDESVEIGEALYEAGFQIVEVPLNSPSPFSSIGQLARALGSRMIVGAGTVLNIEAVQGVADSGGQIVISPNANSAVIKKSVELGLISFPAFFTPTEAFSAIEAGCHALKLFPAELAGPQGLKAMKAVLPKDMPVFPVGGIEPGNMLPYLTAGAAGFGIGSSVFKPGDTAETVFGKARAFVHAWETRYS